MRVWSGEVDGGGAPQEGLVIVENVGVVPRAGKSEVESESTQDDFVWVGRVDG